MIYRDYIFVFAALLTMGMPARSAESKPEISSNAFSGPLNVGAGMRFSAENEDISNPFTEAHPTESYRYLALYERFYGLHAPIEEPLLSKLPSATDREGHPLWFDGPKGENDLSSLVDRLFGQAKFADLDRIYKDWSDPKEVMTDGRPKIAMYWTSLQRLYSDTVDWDKSYANLKAWRQASPRSAAAAVAESLYWIAYAWNARGGTYSDEVTAQGWVLYKERLDKARMVLKGSADFAQGIAWFRTFMDVERQLGAPPARLLSLLRESLKSEPESYTSYVGLVTAQLPWWGGSWEDVDKTIRFAARSESSDGKINYTRLYWFVYKSKPGNIFKNSLARWSEMKEGFQELVLRYPHSGWTMNAFAAFACMAEDNVTYRDLRRRLGDVIVQSAWPSNYSTDLCDHQAKGEAL